MFTLINQLQKSHSCYYIDFLPEKMDSSRYFEIEEFFLNTYLKDFSEKIIRIIVKIIGYYPSQICLTEFSDKTCDTFKDLYPVGENIQNRSIKELSDIISYVIINDISSIQIILRDNNSNVLISINGGFSVDIYNASEELLKFLTILIEQENLFLRKESQPPV